MKYLLSIKKSRQLIQSVSLEPYIDDQMAPLIVGLKMYIPAKSFGYAESLQKY